jgi:hypothetical protein
MATNGNGGKRRIDEDVYCGIALVLLAAFALYVARDYPVGRAEEMGPGYFPRALAALMGALGLALAAAGFLRGEPGRASEDRLSPRPILAVAAALAAFGLTLRGLGLLPAVALSSAIAAYAIPGRRATETAAIVAAMVAMATGIWYVVRIATPLIAWG